MSAGSHLLVLLISFILLPTTGHAISSNVTIDDASGDPVTGVVPSYVASGTASWTARSGSTVCEGCLSQPDASQASDATWHDITSGAGQDLSNATFPFTGTAIYIYCILANYIPYATTDTHLSFYIDDELVGAYNHIPNISSNAYQYNQLVYKNTSVPNSLHNVTTDTTSSSSSSTGPTKQPTSLTTSTTSTASPTPESAETPQPKAKSRGVQIAVAVVATGVGLGLVLLLFWLYVRKRRVWIGSAPAAVAIPQSMNDASSHVPPPDPFILPVSIRSRDPSRADTVNPDRYEQRAARPQSPPLTLPRGPPTSAGGWKGDAKTDPTLASSPAVSSAPASGSRNTELEEEVARLREEVEQLRANDVAPPMYETVAVDSETVSSRAVDPQ
ncbi:hypothetical protein EXIGLDRAFT_775689 [Exidia glandulosa HHB12029]|uniref:Mid2 domain-containing protein n=1 Tax=Exidia glandulosa HHB12029 TaxID=1314781 RepID=A0A165DTS0_EXIGL|nr:hypothetical protein EXIGLDRAFT_775689 [Exidia glandulosa HHB12029]